MDPFTLSLITGIISTCLYSSVLRIADEAVDIPLNEKNIIDRLMKNEASFASLIEKTIQNISPAVKKEIFYEFLKSDEGIEIVKRIYSYDLSDEGELNNLEKIKDDFCKRVILYFENSKEKQGKIWHKYLPGLFHSHTRKSYIVPQSEEQMA